MTQPTSGPADFAGNTSKGIIMTKRVVLAYSGGLDTSVAVRWLIENKGVEVIASRSTSAKHPSRAVRTGTQSVHGHWPPERSKPR